ncbi:hypothetical protein SPRG_10017 [Saprolegnia parasitica CBS 223.65]|uniref:Uncharacterized protein n=1 Tax=Saprolegnia parasitica (strain CBS 223.65) TaxID=695850 RepID=A0A067BY90_SAPPC|nr:hypothetical protein SPRG_10017 [Saprolegnia parasitica CBS 223.65]KDO23208.1 hypothetical protein SPRG_10017 [Saprolegnia parasitica CBS 223.65]|eukprot:XP_012206159.1 hypothetical protein SPRG_10017 [Saprolegnia parasitica CBS 223.65]
MPTVEESNQGRKRKATHNATEVAAVEAVVSSPLPAASCSFVDSKHVFPTNANKRNCIVCTYERSTRKQKTVHCQFHQVNLCSIPQDSNREAEPYECPNVDWPCWKKYHEFYLQHDVFQKTNGRQNKKSALYKLKASMVGPAAKKRKDDSHELD